jgi:5'-3' exonuclease
MGIPSYFSHLVRSYRGILKKASDAFTKVDNLYLDSNSIIYDCARAIEYDGNDQLFEKLLIEAVCQKIAEYIRLLSPSEALVAFDGVAPVAKLEQQRNRRYKSWLEGEVSKSMGNAVADQWCTASITPGTAFMASLAVGVRRYFDGFGDCLVTVSSSEEAGEGEHKIFDEIRGAKGLEDRVCVVYGLDADLIMLTLNHLHITKNMYLFRETPHFIRSIDNTLDPNELYCLDVPELASSIQMELTGVVEDASRVRRVHDYIVLCFLLGNDFMPHFPALNIRTTGVDRVMEAYRTTIGVRKNVFMTRNGSLNWGAIRQVLSFLRNKETSYLKEEMELRKRMSKRATIRKKDQTKQEVFQLLPIIDRSMEMYIDPCSNGEEWKKRYYDVLFECDYTENRMRSICTSYLEALEWTFTYYNTGCPDWRWCYPYHYAPLLEDLLPYVPHFEARMIAKREKAPIDPETQLCYVLPRPFHHLLKKDEAEMLEREMGDAYKTEWPISWAFCKYFWESHACMSSIDVDHLQNRLREIRLLRE